MRVANRLEKRYINAIHLQKHYLVLQTNANNHLSIEWHGICSTSIFFISLLVFWFFHPHSLCRIYIFESPVLCSTLECTFIKLSLRQAETHAHQLLHKIKMFI